MFLSELLILESPPINFFVLYYFKPIKKKNYGLVYLSSFVFLFLSFFKRNHNFESEG